MLTLVKIPFVTKWEPDSSNQCIENKNLDKFARTIFHQNKVCSGRNVIRTNGGGLPRSEYIPNIPKSPIRGIG